MTNELILRFIIALGLSCGFLWIAIILISKIAKTIEEKKDKGD